MNEELKEYHNPEYNGTYRVEAVSFKNYPFLPLDDVTGTFTVHGNCMEGSKIYDGDTVFVDLDRFPRKGDACICSIDNQFVIKRYNGRTGKQVFDVSTNYDFGGKQLGPNGEMNRGYWIEKIYGVVFACLSPEQSLRWKIDPLTLPKEPGEIMPQRGNVRFASFVKKSANQ